jgi:D-alanine transaminase
MPDLASVNGKITPPEQAVVSIDDRGFLFGDAVYEAMRVYSGRPFALDRHQARFRRSLSELGITGVDVDAVGRDILDLIAKSGLQDAVVYYQASRGVHAREHVPPAGLKPTVVVTVREYHHSGLLDHERGVSVITVPDIRWGRVDIKTTNLLPNCLAKMEAKKAGCYEAILLDGDVVREACSTAVLMVVGGRIVAPEQGPWILPSITREVCEQLAREDRIPLESRTVKAAELWTADEVFLMGSSTEVAGIVRVDGKPVGGGKVGPMTRRLHRLYRAYAARTLDLPESAIR